MGKDNDKTKNPDVKVLADGKVMKVQKTRQRKILSCVYCHSKKIKCSRTHPTCINCDKLGIDCQYFINDRVSKGGKNRKNSMVGNDDMPSSNDASSFTKSLTPPDHETGHQPHQPQPSTTTVDNNKHDNPHELNPVTKDNVKQLNPINRFDDLSPNFPNLSRTLLLTHIPNFYDDNNQPPQDGAGTSLEKEDQFSFGLSSFTFANYQNQQHQQHQQQHQQHQQPPLQSQQMQNNQPHQQLPSSSMDHSTSQNQDNPINGSNDANNNENLNQQNISNLNNITLNNINNLNNLNGIHNVNNNDNKNLQSLTNLNSLTQSFKLNQDLNIKRNGSNTNISSLFAKNPPNIYPQTNIQNFMDQQRTYDQRKHSHASNDALQLHQLDQTHHHEAIPNQDINLQNNNINSNNIKLGLDLDDGNIYQPMESSNSTSTATFELNHHLAHTKNFLNGTNAYYANENLLDDLENHIPNSKKRSYELIERYIKSVHLLLPIITNIDDFIVEHDKFWNDCNPYDKQLNNSMTDINLIQFYTLYFPILYASTISEFEEYDNLLLNQEIDKYLKGFNKICQYYNYPHGLKTIPLLLGNVLIQSTSPNPSTMEMSQIIRYAKFLQINKDPIISLKIKSNEIIKFRRLLWWTIFGLDCLTSHNFCLPPVCKFEDFNVLLPNDQEPIYNENNGEIIGYKLNISTLSMNIKFRYDRILNEEVQLLHSDNSKNLSTEKMNEIKKMINDYFEFVHDSINKINIYHNSNPPKSVNENNLINFLKNHSWSFVDRALMLLHKKHLLNESPKNNLKTELESEIPIQNNNFNRSSISSSKSMSNSISGGLNGHNQNDSDKNNNDGASNDLVVEGDKQRRLSNSYDINLTKPRNGILSYNDFEDTFQNLAESNLIKNFINFKDFNINLTFNQTSNFSYNDLTNNLVPSILHNLNDFLKYNDFLKFGKFNWYVKRTIPLDSIIILFIVIIVKFKYQIIKFNELLVYVKLINKSLFILNRKWFKNEKYKRMLSLTNLTWEFILKKFKILHLINKFTNSNFSIASSPKNKIFNKYEYFNYQLTGYINTTELFKTMKVAQPILSNDFSNKINDQRIKYSITSSVSTTPLPIELQSQAQLQSHFSNGPNNHEITMSIATPIPVGTPNPLDFMDSTTPTTLSKIQNTLIDTPKAAFDLTNFQDTNEIININESNSVESNELFQVQNDFIVNKELLKHFNADNDELVLLKSKIEFDLKNNFVDINDYCAFYISLENILSELIRFIES